MLLAWSLIYKHNFTPHRFYIWNNRYILYKNKSLFFQKWYDNNILLVNQLFNQRGQLYNYTEFIHHFGIPISPKDFSIVFDAIPSAVFSLFKGANGLVDSPTLVDVKETTVGNICFSLQPKSKNKAVRQLFQQDTRNTPTAVSYWSSFVGDICWEKVWLLPHKFFFNQQSQRDLIQNASQVLPH